MRHKVYFFGPFFNNVNKGPSLQSTYKAKFFGMYSNDIPIDVEFKIHGPGNFNGFENKPFHCLFPSEMGGFINTCKNFTTGPNIAGCLRLSQTNLRQPDWLFKDRALVADSYWAKEGFCECYPTVDPKNVSIITTYIDEAFYKTPMDLTQEDFIIGMVGFPGGLSGLNNIKNLDVVFKLARKRTNWKFEICANRQQYPTWFSNQVKQLDNVRVFNVPHDKMHLLMSRWSCYLGVGKVERGPTTIQEANVLGCPTVCSDHSGYSDFEPSIPLPIDPFIDIDENNLKVIDDALMDLHKNKERYFEESKIKKERFWKERTPDIITKKWKTFLYENLIK